MYLRLDVLEPDGSEEFWVPLLQREPVVAIAAEVDQRRQVRLLGRLARTILEGADRSQQVLLEAAASDPSLEDLVIIDDQRRRITHRAFIEMLQRNGPLRPGLALDDATDTYSALSNPGTYSFMTRRRGWTPDQFEQWIVDCLELLLLPAISQQGATPQRRRRDPSP